MGIESGVEGAKSKQGANHASSAARKFHRFGSSKAIPHKMKIGYIDRLTCYRIK
jgi:hypothetical protein